MPSNGRYAPGRPQACRGRCGWCYLAALLTADGKVYQIAGGLADNKNDKLIAHISHTVEITGDTMGSGDSLMIHASELKMVSAK